LIKKTEENPVSDMRRSNLMLIEDIFDRKSNDALELTQDSYEHCSY